MPPTEKIDDGASAAVIASRRAGPFYIQLWFLLLAAMVIGVAFGHFYPDAGMRMEALGDGFIRAIRMLIAPIIFCTVVHGIASMADMARVGRVAIKAIIYFEVLTTIALVIGLLAVNLFAPGMGMNVDLSHVDTSSVKPYLAQTRSRTTTQFLLNIIPQTMVGAFGEGNVLQVLLISVLFGFALSAMGESGKAINDLIGTAARCSSAGRNGDVGGADWSVRRHRFHGGQIRRGFAGVARQAAGQFLSHLPDFHLRRAGAGLRWCGFSLPKFIRYLREELLIVFATTSSETVLPRMIAKLEEPGAKRAWLGL